MRDYWIPVLTCFVLVRIIRSSTMKRSRLKEGLCQFPIVDYLACSILVYLSDEVHKAGWNSIVFEKGPIHGTYNTVKTFSKSTHCGSERDCHSRDCLMMILRTAVMSVQDFFVLETACSGCSFLSSESFSLNRMILVIALGGTDSRTRKPELALHVDRAFQLWFSHQFLELQAVFHQVLQLTHF